MACLLAWAPHSATGQILVREMTTPGLTNSSFVDAIATNGSLVAVGKSFDDTQGLDAGAVFVFNLSTGAFVRKIMAPALNPSNPSAPHGDANDGFGASVAVAGNLLAVGTVEEEAGGDKRGAVYLYTLSTGALLRVITNPAGNDNDRFGLAVAMAGDFLVIGTPHRSLPGVAYAGAVYVYNLRTNVLGPAIGGTTPETEANFGSAVAVNACAGGGLIAVGSPFRTAGGVLRGAAFLIDAATGNEITVFNGSSDHERFGTCVTLGRDRLYVGAPMWNGPQGSFQGYVNAYNLANLSLAWFIPGVAAFDECGTSIAASGDLVAISTPGHDLPGGPSDMGRVQVVQQRDGAAVATLHPPALQGNAFFGREVAVHGSTVMIMGVAPPSVIAYAPVRSNLPFTEIAVKNSMGPEAPDTTFLSFDQLAVSPNGLRNVVLAKLAGPGAAGGKNVGVWNYTPSGAFVYPDLVQRTGLPLGVTTAKVTSVSNPLANLGTHVGFTATLSGQGITAANDRVFLVSDGTNPPTAPLGEDKVVSGARKVLSFQQPRMSTVEARFLAPVTYRLVPGQVTAANDSGFVFFNPTVIESSVSEGSLNLFLGLNYGQFVPRNAFHMNVGEIFTFTSYLTGSSVNSGNNLAFFRGSSPMARKGGNVFYFDNSNFGTYSNFLGDAINGQHPLLRATVIPPAGSAGMNEGILTNRTTGANALTMALLKGFEHEAVPPFNPLKIKRFLRFGADNTGSIHAWVTLQGAGVTAANDGAIVLCRFAASEADTVLEVLLREGYPAPGCGRARIAAIQQFDVEGNGGYGVLASLVTEGGGATAADNQALFIGRSAAGAAHQTALRQPILILRKGQQFVRAGSPAVKSIALPGLISDAAGALNSGLAHVMNTYPSARAVVTWSDGQVSVLDPYP